MGAEALKSWLAAIQGEFHLNDVRDRNYFSVFLRVRARKQTIINITSLSDSRPHYSVGDYLALDIM